MKRFLTDTSYGLIIPDLVLENKLANYGVINEREARAVAGLMFLIGICTFFLVVLGDLFQLLYIIVPLFWLEFGLKTILGPKFSLFGQLIKPLIARQKPEYVGAIQKRFAWTLGLLMASAMLIVITFNLPSIFALILCITCLGLMWIESALGICVGCAMYSRLISAGVIPKPDSKPVCAGGVCSID